MRVLQRSAMLNKRIRGAMLDALDEIRERETEQAPPGGSAAVPPDPTRQFLALIEEREWDDSSFTEGVALFLSGHETLDDWRAFIQSAPFEKRILCATRRSTNTSKF